MQQKKWQSFTMKVSDSIVLPEDSLEIIVRFVRLYDVTLLEENLEIVSPLECFSETISCRTSNGFYCVLFVRVQLLERAVIEYWCGLFVTFATFVNAPYPLSFVDLFICQCRSLDLMFSLFLL